MRVLEKAGLRYAETVSFWRHRFSKYIIDCMKTPLLVTGHMSLVTSFGEANSQNTSSLVEDVDQALLQKSLSKHDKIDNFDCSGANHYSMIMSRCVKL